MWILLIFLVAAIAIVASGTWLKHRERTVDSYHSRDHGDPPAGIPPTW